MLKNMPERRVFVAALLAVLLVRVGFLLLVPVPFESDEAIVGLMARHILYAGDRPIFYYGQEYMGPLEPATAALSFALFGPTLFTLRLAPSIWSVVFVGFSAAYARRALGRPAFWWTLAYLGVPPLFLITWSVKARGGYPELLALGAILLYQALDLQMAPDGRDWRWPLFGAVSGLALWTDPLVVVYLGPATLYLILHLRARLFRWTSPAAVAAAVVAALPMLQVNIAQPGITLRQLAGPAVNAPITAHQLAHNFSEAIQQSIPVLLGIYQGCSYRPVFFAARAASGIPFAPVAFTCFVLALAAGVLFVVSTARAVADRPTPADLILWVCAVTMVPFILTQQQADYVTEPRYLLPLYAAVPLFGFYWSKLWRRWSGVAYVVLLVALVVNVSGYVRFLPDLAGPFIDNEPVRTGDIQLARLLEEQGVKTVYANYWLSYPIAFQTGEAVKTAVIGDRLTVGFNRVIPYAIAAGTDPQPALLVVTGSPDDLDARNWLDQHHARFQVHRWENLTLYDHISAKFSPLQG